MGENLDGVHAEGGGGFDRFVHAACDGEVRPEEWQIKFPMMVGIPNEQRWNVQIPTWSEW